ncbi:hypothetical protein [Kitasatospora sp. NPDC057500]|uniref:hypothetical protein n=1 Tax=Kitasatospora sp. NPDC057500 TaxID=3346151 RepID=UPI003699F242
MTGSEFAARDPRAGEGADEDTGLTAEDREVADELRVLLQLAAPHLSAPEDRMERVLGRVARTRRRRRRAALAGGLAIGLTSAVLVAAPALAPGPPDTALSPAAPGPASSGPTVGGSAGVKTVRFSGMADLVVDVPADWYDLTKRPAAGSGDPVGYLSSQRIAVPAACPGRTGLPVCIASGALDVDGVLISIRMVREQDVPGGEPGEAGALASIPPDEECTAWGGTQQNRGYRPYSPNRGNAVVELTACLRGPSAATLTTVEKTFASVRPLLPTGLSQ